MKKNTNIGFFIFFLGALFYCYEYFLRISPSVMQHQLMQSFLINATLFGTLSAFYFYSYTPMQFFVGLIVDKYDIRIIMIISIFCCTLGTFLIGNTHIYLLASFGRFLQGIGSAFAFVGSLKLASIYLRYDKFANFTGIVTMLGFLGASIGTVFMENMVEKIGWRHTLHIFTALGFLLILAFFISIKSSYNKNFSITPNSESFQESLKKFWLICKIKRLWFTGIYAGLMFLPTSVFAALWGIPYLEKLHFYSVHKSSIAVSMIFLGWSLGSLMIGILSDYLDKRVILLQIGSFVAFWIVLPILYIQSMPYIIVCLMFFLFGAFSSVQILSFVIAKDISPYHSVGTSIAFVNAITMLGGMFFQRGLGEILDWSWSGKIVNKIPFYSLHDYKIAISVIPISVGLAFFISFLLKKDQKFIE